MLRLVSLLITAFLLGASSAPATPSVEPGVPTYVIQGAIRKPIVELGEKLLEEAEKGTTKVQLIINSPGGAVVPGFQFLSMMDAARAKGVHVVCFVPGVAASMAFQILVHCDERHTLNNAFLLWHRARVQLGGLFGEPITGPQAAILARDLEAIDEAIFSELNKALGRELGEKDVRYHFEVETLHIGRNLHAMAPKFITTHAYIPGLMEALRAQQETQSDMEDFTTNQIIYITDKVK